MASYAGEGPAGKYCRDCANFGEVAVLRPDGAETVEKNRRGCVIWAASMGHASPVSGRSIELSDACKHFAEAKQPVSRFIIDQVGEIIPVDQFPQRNLHLWALARRKAAAE